MSKQREGEKLPSSAMFEMARKKTQDENGAWKRNFAKSHS